MASAEEPAPETSGEEPSAAASEAGPAEDHVEQSQSETKDANAGAGDTDANAANDTDDEPEDEAVSKKKQAETGETVETN